MIQIIIYIWFSLYIILINNSNLFMFILIAVNSKINMALKKYFFITHRLLISEFKFFEIGEKSLFYNKIFYILLIKII